MILEPSSRKTTGKVRSYEDPLFRSKRGKLGLAKLLHKANMLRVVSRQRGPAVKCFTVLKKVNSDGSMSLRLVFDLRGTNCEFCPAPFCNLANAANFAYIDLSSDVIGDGRLIAWQGDIPNFFYKLQIPHSLSEFFCLEGVTAKELFSALGREVPPGTLGNKLAIQVVSMGWSWAPFLAHMTLLALLAGAHGPSSGPPTLTHGSVVPSLFPHAIVQFAYIDDAGALALEGIESELGSEVAAWLARFRAYLRSRGFGLHKDAVSACLEGAWGSRSPPRGPTSRGSSG